MYVCMYIALIPKAKSPQAPHINKELKNIA